MLVRSVGRSVGLRTRLAHHVDRLETLRPLLDFELDELVLEEPAAPLTRDLRVVHEHARAFLLLDEPPALLVVEPLDPSHCHRSASTSTVPTSAPIRLLLL